MRRRLCVLDLSRLRRGGMEGEDRRALADGGGHARFRLRREAELAPLLPDQGERGPRRPGGEDAGAASVMILPRCGRPQAPACPALRESRSPPRDRRVPPAYPVG